MVSERRIIVRQSVGGVEGWLYPNPVTRENGFRVFFFPRIYTVATAIDVIKGLCLTTTSFIWVLAPLVEIAKHAILPSSVWSSI